MITQEDDKAMMSDPMNWPLYPVLPLKRRKAGSGTWPDLGIMIDHENTRNIVFMCSVDQFMAIRDLDGIKKIPNLKYASVDDILADGWVVD